MRLEISPCVVRFVPDLTRRFPVNVTQVAAFSPCRIIRILVFLGMGLSWTLQNRNFRCRSQQSHTILSVRIPALIIAGLREPDENRSQADQGLD